MNNWGVRSAGMFGPRFIKFVVCVVLIALLPMAAGCYGTFPLTRVIYKFNGEITHSDLVHSIVLWVFLIVPVYWIAFLGDFIVLNLVEFWTGEKFFSSTQTLEDGTLIALTASADGHEAALVVSRDGVVLQKMRFVRTSEKEVQAFDDAGRQAGRIIRTPSSGLVLMDAQGASVRTIGAGEILQFRKAMDRFQTNPARQMADPG